MLSQKIEAERIIVIGNSVSKPRLIHYPSGRRVIEVVVEGKPAKIEEVRAWRVVKKHAKE